MLDEATRTAIFKLHEQGHGSRAIAQALKVARATVRQVIRSGHRTVPPLLRAERCEPWREQILELHAQYQGHLGRGVRPARPIHNLIRTSNFPSDSIQFILDICLPDPTPGEAP